MLIPLLSTLLLLLTTSLSTAETLKIYAQPVPPTTAPSAIFELSYDPSTQNATLKSFTAPKTPPTDPLSPIRLGLYDTSASSWKSSVLTSSASFSERIQKRLKLFIDPTSNTIYHVGFVATERPVKEALVVKKKKTKSHKEAKELERQERKEKKARKQGKLPPVKGEELEEEVLVEVVKREEGPRPTLNKPIVVNAEGKVEEGEPEKTFLQKYWWIIAVFLLLQVVAGGAGEK